MTRRRTTLLVMLLIACACATAAAHAHLRDRRAGASQARASLNESKRQLDELHRWRSGAEADAVAEPDASHLARVLRAAAAEADAAGKLASIEPGQPQRLSGDYAQLPVFLRLESISMKQLTLFLHRLATLDGASRAQGIELSVAGSDGPSELWNADVTIAYLTFAPGEQRR